MIRTLLLAALLLQPCLGQVAGPGLAQLLQFEAAPSGNLPGGWNGAPLDTISVDSEIVHGGKHSVRFDRKADSVKDFSVISIHFPIEFTGKTVELRGFLRTQDVSEFAGLWMRESGNVPKLEYDDMQLRNLKGTNDWKEYSIKLPVNPAAAELYIGVLASGTGKVWADDLQLLVDGKPIWEAPKAERAKTIEDSDHEFDTGSHVTITALTQVQIDNLVTLGKVWGFLKYHHPLIASGGKHWDYELFRILPNVLAAPDRASANFALVDWIAKLGTATPCANCASLAQTDLYFGPALQWIDDEALLGNRLSEILKSIYHDRSNTPKQFYVSIARGVGNPVFEHELTYARMDASDAAFRLLGVYRFWNIIEYWFPYRDITGEDWDKVLAETIPKVTLAKGFEEVQLEMMALIARAHDTHANLWSSMALRPPLGSCVAPVNVRFIESRAIVTSFATASSDQQAGLQIGDEIRAIDGVDVSKSVQDWAPYYAVSNEAARLRDMGRTLTRGPCTEAVLAIHRDGGNLSVKIARLSGKDLKFESTHDLPGPTFRLLSKDVAYLKLSSVKGADVAHYIDLADGTKGLIVDIRNYPSEFVVFQLGNLLADHATPFARFTGASAANPGAFRWINDAKLTPAQPHYAGKIIVLVDETSQSQAEYTAMAFRSTGATVVGSMTAGADGNVSAIPLPFGLRTMISGIGVFYPDKKPTQRLGIVPDVPVKPTIAGVRAGRDEVLETGLRQILGTPASEEAVQAMARH